MVYILPKHLGQHKTYSKDLCEGVIYLQYGLQFKISQISYILNMLTCVME